MCVLMNARQKLYFFNKMKFFLKFYPSCYPTFVVKATLLLKKGIYYIGNLIKTHYLVDISDGVRAHRNNLFSLFFPNALKEVKLQKKPALSYK